MNELMSQSVYWQKWTTVGTWAVAFFTLLYVVAVTLTLLYIRKQFKETEKRRKLGLTLTIFKELQTREMRRARKYIYTRVPQDVSEVSESELQEHLEEAESAIAPFDLVGYLIQEEYLDRESILANYWRGIWKCWKKSEHLLRWARRRRNEPIFHHFDDLARESERYRHEKNYEEPTL